MQRIITGIKTWSPLAACAWAVSAVIMLPPPPAQAQISAISGINVTPAGEFPPHSICGLSAQGAISADGRLVAFYCDAPDLTPGDTNGLTDVYVHVTSTGENVLFSRTAALGETDGGSYYPHLSADGRWLVFESMASNLVPGDTNNTMDLFASFTPTGETVRINLSPQGAQSFGGVMGEDTAVSADGSFVAFVSQADDLVENDTNQANDVFVYDMYARAIERVSVSSDGVQGNGPSELASISGDGTLVVFTSAADNLVSGDANGAKDIFLHDRTTHTTTRISTTSAGGEANGLAQYGLISADGRYIVFESLASNMIPGLGRYQVAVFIYDRLAARLSCVSLTPGGRTSADGTSRPFDISSDGRFVVFGSNAPNVLGDEANDESQVYVRDMVAGITIRASMNLAGEQAQDSGGEGGSSEGAISADGRWVAFSSNADNLMPGDTNGVSDLFLVNPDYCPRDSAKDLPGVCGCGTPDLDTDGNGQVDCRPTQATLPYAPGIEAGSRRLTLEMQAFDADSGSAYKYIVRYRRAGQTGWTTKTTRQQRVELRRLSAGLYKVKYRLKSGAVLSRFSPVRLVKVR